MATEKEPLNQSLPQKKFGRVEWVRLAGKNQEGIAYYHTKVVSPCADPYGHPEACVVLSEGQFAKPGEEVTFNYQLRLKTRDADVTNKKTGEIERKTFYSHDVWLAP